MPRQGTALTTENASTPAARSGASAPRTTSFSDPEGLHLGSRWNDRKARSKVGVLLAVYEFPMVAAGLRAVLQQEGDIEIVGEADDGESALDLLRRREVDVAITECMLLNSCVREAVATIETMKLANRQARILVLASQNSTEHFSLALKAGADGFLTREAQPADVLAAIRYIARGQTYVSPEIVTRMMSTYVGRAKASSVEDPYDSLTEREREVLLLVAAGLTNREIAQIVHLSEQTVHNNRARLMEKLGFHDRVELLKYAIRRRLIEVEDL